MIKYVRFIFFLGFCFLQGCTSFLSSSGAGNNDMQQHIVKAGDTLFSIAMSYDLDYRDLATSNRIPPPYTIYPNDVIYLNSGIFSERATKSSPVAPVVSSSSVRQPVSTPIKYPKVVETKNNPSITQNNGVKLATTLHNVNKAPVKPIVAQPVSVVVADNNSTWIWPVQGVVIKPFVEGDVLNKGMDIKNQIGTSILAARSGEVVYAGSGLKGYGNLIIIRHDDVYISAYAHNKVILVKEGQVISKGEKIAELGESGTDTPKLHFEIRRHGKPINPMQLLPKK